MNRDDVLTGLAVLRAAFPHSTIPSETVELYVSRLMIYDADIFSSVVKEVIDSDDHFPTIHRIVEGCRVRRKREEDSHAVAALPAGLPDVDRILPDAAADFRQAVSEKYDATFVNALANVPKEPAGTCEECRRPAKATRRYGKFALCEDCCIRRLRFALSRELVA